VINFRYHVVSLTAVFLALAIGLVVGTAALNGPVADSFKDQIEEFNRRNIAAREQVTQLQKAADRDEEFVREAAPALVGGKLTGRKLLVVVLPTGQEYADGVTSMLTTAGATVTGRVTVQEKFLAPQNNEELLELATKASQPSVPAEGLPVNSVGVETASAQLATALLEKAPAVVPADLKAVLAAYSSAGYVSVSEGATGAAEATVLVSGLPATAKDALDVNRNVVTLATQWGRTRPLVVAGSGIGVGNLVTEVRNDPALVKSFSTVDNADSAHGQLVAALAAAERLAAAPKVGQYGLGPGAESLLPKSAAS
jgi:hypothetical protein